MNFVILVLPAFLILAIGYIGQKKLKIDRKSVSTTALYLMSPFLAFRTFYTNKVSIEYLYIVLFCLTLCAVLLVLILFIGKVKKLQQPKVSAMILSGVFMNSGNYGAPIILFAFGSVGFDYAVIMMVIQSLLMNTVGLYYAAKGSKETNTMKESLMKVVKMPIIYGAALGLIIQVSGLIVPNFVIQAVELIADAAIPTVMLVLGMQLATLSRNNMKLGEVASMVMIKMVVSPIIAYFIIMIFSIEGLLAKILLVLAAMPTAANTTLYALQFNTEPEFVSSSTLITTILSIITVPIMLLLVS
ncbi:AEC family transporter [Metabacillus sediminilitoris]|uniref:AEC family transporter n=1 Tax=Metabacillus sediminilitoris TaxID=2567941 RepID=A0A4V6RXJ7_9BACI|nr:AEC family transporter [Metabacillus sediminilitoris]QGQ44201.1 AEC family transporter [Metabacillus sediminilitoris]THF78165.1 AEC family transporter [Metabacillus sediminilitoris]